MHVQKDSTSFIVKPLVVATALAISCSSLSYAATLNGKEVPNNTVTNATVFENGSSKFVIGQGEVSIQTNASIGKMLANYQKAKEEGKSTLEALRIALAPSGSELAPDYYDHAPITGLIGGEGQLDSNSLKVLDKIKSYGGLIGLNDSHKKLIGQITGIDTVETSSDKTTFNVVKDGDVQLVIGGKGTEPVILGAIGGDASINTGINGQFKALFLTTKFEKQPQNSITRNGSINMRIDSGNVLGGFGASAAIGIGNINVFDDHGNLTFDLKTDGSATTTLNGDVNIAVNNGANLAAFATGGSALAIGGAATSTVNGNTNLLINTTVNTNKLEGLTVGVAGGGFAASTLGGKANVSSGNSTVTINNSAALGVVGGNVSAAVDASKIGGLLAGHEIGNNDGSSDIDFIEDLHLSSAGKVIFNEVYNGGKAIGLTGDSTINLNGSTTAFGVVGGGVAGTILTYNVRDKNKGGHI